MRRGCCRCWGKADPRVLKIRDKSLSLGLAFDAALALARALPMDRCGSARFQPRNKAVPSRQTPTSLGRSQQLTQCFARCLAMEVTLQFDEAQCKRANFIGATALFDFHDHFVGFDQAQSR